MIKPLEQALNAISEREQSELAHGMTDDAKRLAIEVAVAQADASPDGGIPHEEVSLWLESWGTDHELAPPPLR